MEYREPYITSFFVETATDWNMFFVTLGVGILATVATIVAVWYTNKKTRDLYEETRAEERKQNAMVVVKPTLRYASFGEIRDRLLVDGSEERAILLSSKEGFDFYDKSENFGKRHCIFSIINESSNRIDAIKLSVNSTMKTSSDTEIASQFENTVNLMRPGEMILLRVHDNSQYEKYWECLERNESVETSFNCIIQYSLTTKQQVRYEYEIKIMSNPKIHDDGTKTFERKTSIITDAYGLMDSFSSADSVDYSPFRDLQESLSNDKFGYKYRRIGEEQMTGTIEALRRFFREEGITETVAKAAESVENIDKSMQNMSQTFTYFENLTKPNAQNPIQIGAAQDDEVIDTP